MFNVLSKCTPFFLVLFTLTFLDAGLVTDYADAKPRRGGRSFKRMAPKRSQTQMNNQQTPGQKSSFGRGLMGGLLGGAIGGMLFGSLFGAGGSGMGILPLIILGVAGFFLYKRFAVRPASSSAPGYQPPPFGSNSAGGPVGSSPVPPIYAVDPVQAGLDEVRLTDAGFDENNFIEVASDVFFKVQAGWMHRDLDSYRQLLGDTLAGEYEGHFAEMREKGHINKLESIAIRKVEIVDAGTADGEDFVTVLFTANLLDYTVDDKSGDLVGGSMTEPIKFAEKWTWARPVRSESWKLEGIADVE